MRVNGYCFTTSSNKERKQTMSSNAKVVNAEPNYIQSNVRQTKLWQKTSKWKLTLLNAFALTLISIAFCSLPLLWLLKIEIKSLSLIGFTLALIGLLFVVACLEKALQENRTIDQ